MQPDIETLLATFQGQFEPGSIVEQSIRTAYDQIHKGNIMVAQSILKYLAIPESLKNQILGNQSVVQSQPDNNVLNTVTATPSAIPVVLPNPTPLAMSAQQGDVNPPVASPQSVLDAIFVSVNTNPVPTPSISSPMSAPLPVPQKPKPAQPVPAPTPTTSLTDNFITNPASSKATGTVYSIPKKQPVTPPTDTTKSSASTGAPIPALSEQPKSLDAVWESFAKKNIEESANPLPSDIIQEALTATANNPTGTSSASNTGLFTKQLNDPAPTTNTDPHLAPPGKRTDAFDALLAQARTKNATIASGKIAPDAEIPLIHTYAEPESGRERTMVSAADTAQAEKLFRQAQTYLEKSLADGSPEMIQSAQRAVTNLYTRYPFYRERKSEHANQLDVLMQQRAKQETTTDPQDRPVGVPQDGPGGTIQKLSLAGTDVHVGMSITGKSGAKYILEKIERIDGLHTLLFTSDGNQFRISSSAIESALKNPNTEPDTFFAGYRM